MLPAPAGLSETFNAEFRERRNAYLASLPSCPPAFPPSFLHSLPTLFYSRLPGSSGGLGRCGGSGSWVSPGPYVGNTLVDVVSQDLIRVWGLAGQPADQSLVNKQMIPLNIGIFSGREKKAPHQSAECSEIFSPWSV